MNVAPGEEGRGVGTRVLGILLLALVLHAPCLGWGFFIDDYGHQIVLQDLVEHPTMKPWSLYDFGSLADIEKLQANTGAFPWWTSADWSVRFFRPVSSLSLWLDSALFGGWAPGFHLSGLVLFAGLLLAAFALFRALQLPPGAALVALLVLGLEDGTVMPVGWIANRNGLVEALLTTLALLVLVRGARAGRRSALPFALALALLLGTASMLAKESGLSALVLIAWVAWRSPTGAVDGWSPRARAIGAGGALFLVAAYLVFFVAAGYGAHSEFYPPPWQDPLAFLGRLVILLPAAATAMLTPVTSDLLLLFPGATWPAVVVAGVVLLPVAIAIWRAVRSHPAAPFLAVWVVCTLLPQAGAPMSDRLLLVPTVGVAGLLGLFVHGTLRRAAAPAASPGRRRLARLVVTSAILLSAPALLVRGLSLYGPIALARNAILEAEVETGGGVPCEAVILQSPTELACLHPVSIWAVENGNADVRFWPLQGGRRALRWTRIDERTFELESLDAPFLTGLLEEVFLSDTTPPPLGQRWTTSLFTAEAVAVDEAGLRRVRFTMPRALEAPELCFLTWREGRWRRIGPPEVGESIELATVPAPLLLSP